MNPNLQKSSARDTQERTFGTSSSKIPRTQALTTENEQAEGDSGRRLRLNVPGSDRRSASGGVWSYLSLLLVGMIAVGKIRQDGNKIADRSSDNSAPSSATLLYPGVSATQPHLLHIFADRCAITDRPCLIFTRSRKSCNDPCATVEWGHREDGMSSYKRGTIVNPCSRPVIYTTPQQISQECPLRLANTNRLFSGNSPTPSIPRYTRQRARRD